MPTKVVSAKTMVDPTSRILTFIEHAKSRKAEEVKSNERFSATDAVWDIEAALNFSIGQYSKPCSELSSDSLVLPLVAENDSYSAADVYEIFNAALSALVPISNEEQHLVLVDVEEPTAGSTTIRLYYLIGSGYEKANPPNSSYGSNDHRWWGYPGSSSGPCNCGGNSNTFARCADKEIEYRINVANTYTMNPNQYLLTRHICIDISARSLDRSLV